MICSKWLASNHREKTVTLALNSKFNPDQNEKNLHVSGCGFIVYSCWRTINLLR